MPRNRQPKPQGMRIDFNPSTTLYDIEEEGVTYSMPLELTRRVKDYYRIVRNGGEIAMMKTFYLDLSKEERSKVIVKGLKPKDQSDFYPDPQYD